MSSIDLPEDVPVRIRLEWEAGGRKMVLTGVVKNPGIDYEPIYDDYIYSTKTIQTGSRAQFRYLKFIPDDKSGNMFSVEVSDKKFEQIKEVAVIVPALTGENIALAAAQAGFEATDKFEVKSLSNSFVLTFREEN